MYQDIVVNLPIDPPWIDFSHYAECEDRKLFQCPECKSLVPDIYLNVCECSLKFIPRITECVCEILDNQTWDEIAKERGY